MNQDDALARAISNAEAAERLLAWCEIPALSSPQGTSTSAQAGSYRIDEEGRAAGNAAAIAHAQIAQAWAAIATQLATPADALAKAALRRQRDSAERRARS